MPPVEDRADPEPAEPCKLSFACLQSRRAVFDVVPEPGNEGIDEVVGRAEVPVGGRGKHPGQPGRVGEREGTTMREKLADGAEKPAPVTAGVGAPGGPAGLLGRPSPGGPLGHK